MNTANLIEGITERADAGNWCKRLSCTTCGARDLRAAFAEHSPQELVDGLKALTHDFISDNFDIFLFAASVLQETLLLKIRFTCWELHLHPVICTER